MEMIEQKAQHKEVAEETAPAMRATNVVDLVKVLQESLNRNQSLKPKRNGLPDPPAVRLLPSLSKSGARPPRETHSGVCIKPQSS